MTDRPNPLDPTVEDRIVLAEMKWPLWVRREGLTVTWGEEHVGKYGHTVILLYCNCMVWASVKGIVSTGHSNKCDHMKAWRHSGRHD